jgi:prephenate dehydrogenase
MSTGSVQNITILGTGLIGASLGLALRKQGFSGSITGWDKNPGEAATALHLGAIQRIADDPVSAAQSSDITILATPVLAILDWMEKLAPVLRPGQLLTDVGSTKQRICEHAARLFPSNTSAEFLAGHPMAGKEVFGAEHADAQLFQGAVWLFTPQPSVAAAPSPLQQLWRGWVQTIGCRIVDTDPARHDELCAWASHLPQMVGTALAALLEENFGVTPAQRAELRDVGGRALREMTRLGASPYSMWRDIAQTNADALSDCLLALEQRLAHIRENLKQPELRAEFDHANQFRKNF